MVSEPRHARFRRRAADFTAAFASAGFQAELADLRARCRAARDARRGAFLSAADFDDALERREGWALEPIGNIFA